MATTRRSASALSAVGGTQLTVETERWLSPMLVALLLSEDGGAAFGRFMESLMIAAVVEAIFDDVPVGARGLDWIRLGQLVRAELDWNHYPAVPSPSRSERPSMIW